MEYRSGSIGRVIIARFDHGDDLLEEFKNILRRENIRTGWFQILGGAMHAGVVTGPKAPIMPPDPVWEEVDGAREVLGGGSVFWDGDEPLIHMHAALGHHGETLTACVRRNTKVYLIIEMILFEVNDIDATRPWFEAGGFNQLQFTP